MKVGIITIHQSPNYGACLQSYALWKYIAGQGHDAQIIDLCRPWQKEYLPSKRFRPFRHKKSFFTSAKSLVKKLLRYPQPKLFSDEAKTKFDSFNSQIKLSEKYRCVDELYDNPPQYDLYISGSDQIWNPEMGYCMEPYFLTFAPHGAKKISYASSIAIDNLENDEKEFFKKCLDSYTAISVREKQAQILLQKITGRSDIRQVPDPSFLLDIQEWENLAIHPDLESPYILLFILGWSDKLVDYAKRLASESGLRLVVLTQIQPDCAGESYIPVRDAGPKEFLGYIANAKLVITDSFHGTVFSLIMGADNFYTYIEAGNKRGSRITSLFEAFNFDGGGVHLLHENLGASYDELQSNKIDRAFVIGKIKQIQNSGRDFIKPYL